MSDALKRVIPIYIVLVVYLFVNFLIKYTSLAKFYILFLNPLFLLLISILVYFITDGFRIRNRNKYSKSQNVIIIILGYCFLYYLSGLIFGYLKNGYSLTINGIFCNFISYFLIVIFKEYIRYRLICSSKSFSNLFVITLLFILLDIDFNYFLEIDNIVSIFNYFLGDIIPIIIMNIISTYLIYRIGSIPNYIYRGFIAGVTLFSPIIPNLEWIVSDFFLLVLLVVLIFSVDHLVDLEDRRKKRVKKENSFTFWIFLVFAAVFILFMIGVFKYQPIAILSDSMKDYYARGDAVVIEKIDEEDINIIDKGDIIYYKYDGKYITHRVIDIKVENDYYVFYTKGDNNDIVDPWEVGENDIIGIVRFRVKYIGWPSVWLYELLS